MVHSQQFVVGARGVGQWPVRCYSWRSSWRVAGRGSRLSGGCRSFSTRTVDRSLWSMVRRRHHRLRTPSGCTPLGHVVFAQVRNISQVVRTFLPSRLLPKCRSPHLVARPRHRRAGQHRGRQSPRQDRRQDQRLTPLPSLPAADRAVCRKGAGRASRTQGQHPVSQHTELNEADTAADTAGRVCELGHLVCSTSPTWTDRLRQPRHSRRPDIVPPGSSAPPGPEPGTSTMTSCSSKLAPAANRYTEAPARHVPLRCQGRRHRPVKIQVHPVDAVRAVTKLSLG